MWRPKRMSENTARSRSSNTSKEALTLVTPAAPQVLSMEKFVHLVLQSKGGIGKTYVAGLLAQAHWEAGVQVSVIDADPLAPKLSRYKSLDPTRLDLMRSDNRDELDPRKFDLLVEMLAARDMHFVIDTGSGSFAPLISYVKENGALAGIFRRANKALVVHTVVTGGPELEDTLVGFADLLTNFKPRQEEDPNAEAHLSARIIAWLNGFKGDVAMNGVGFNEMEVYRGNARHVESVIALKRYSAATFGEDVNYMLSHHLTFEEVQKSRELTIAAKSRLEQVRRDIFRQLKSVPLFSYLTLPDC